MVAQRKARTTTATVAEAPAAPTSKFQLEEDLPTYTRGASLDPDLLDALKATYERGVVFSLDPVADTPPIAHKTGAKAGEFRHDAGTAEQYIRRHATHLGYGVKVRVLDNGRVAFQAVDKRVVPTGDARKPRTPKAK